MRDNYCWPPLTFGLIALKMLMLATKLLLTNLHFTRLVSIYPLVYHCKYNDDVTVSEEMPSGSKEITTTVSSLRIDNIASTGLSISRRVMWEHFMDGQVMHNGQLVSKKSAIVKEGDIIDVDSILTVDSRTPGSDQPGNTGKLVRTGRVMVKEVGEQTKKGRWKVTLHRHKNFKTLKQT